MKSILVPIDFSDNSVLAFRYALHIASESDFNIRLIHVYELPLFERFLNEEVVRTVPEDERDRLFGKFIEKAAEGDPSLKEVDIEWVVREGNIAAEIEKYADEIDPLLIITGSQGSGSDQWDQLLVGGTAQKMLRKMIIPVMLVPPDAVYKPIRKIAYATDFNSEDNEIIEELIGFAKYFNATVNAVHIQEDKWDVDEAKLEEMNSKFSDDLESGKLTLDIIRHDNVMDALDEYVDEHDITLLALLKKFHNLWDRLVDRSMAIKIAMHAHIPTIVFKET